MHCVIQFKQPWQASRRRTLLMYFCCSCREQVRALSWQRLV